MRAQPCFADNKLAAGVAQADVGALVSAFFPHGRREALEAISDLYCWQFVFDDLIESLARHDLTEAANRQFGFLRRLEAPESSVLAHDPFADAYLDIVRRLEQLAPPGVWQRWIGLNRSFSIGVIWACIYRATGTVPPFDTFNTLRPLDAGAPNSGAVLIELAEGFAVPDDQLNHPYIRTVTDLTGTILSWDNDICSYLAETERQLEQINLVTVLAHHHKIGPREAAVKAIHLRNRAMWCYLRLREHSPFRDVPGHATVRRYVSSLDQLIPGNLHWSIDRSHRYRTHHPALGLTRHARSTNHLDGQDLTLPIESPTLRWWWEGLAPDRPHRH
ncbi:hypothetical protein ACH429_03540 [Streptomyces pathocidini]|uniref:Terpene synthase n=1 Tax=Streptomyces pathocidini TaxID=1650571 RepID=A0ABW7UKK5_9ACTN|nr:hypothetical protein [Streptomyces pathocidini]